MLGVGHLKLISDCPGRACAAILPLWAQSTPASVLLDAQDRAMANSVPIPTQAGKSMVSLQAQATVLLQP